MIALFDFVPRYCPQCGQITLVVQDPAVLSDYSSYMACYCPHCELLYQKANTNALLKASQMSGGDLHRDFRIRLERLASSAPAENGDWIQIPGGNGSESVEPSRVKSTTEDLPASSIV